MNIWLCKNNTDSQIESYSNVNLIEENDIIYIYQDDYDNGSFLLKYKLQYLNGIIDEIADFNEINIDLPYSVLYKTKNENTIIKLIDTEKKFILGDNESSSDDTKSNKSFISFLKYITPNTDEVDLTNINFNIQFNIGQPNTGKSYNFDKSRIFVNVDEKHYRYKKIPVSGGIGNEYKGLQNTDLAITYDPIKKELKFGEFLQILMSAIVNPTIPHVIFLDDFHNQDISSLLSEYTPLFKAQQKRDLTQQISSEKVYNNIFKDTDDFIQEWNSFIGKYYNNIPIVPLTNRISGHSLDLVYPSNFYLLGAANFNENTLNIFADWEDRANINYINPIDSFSFILNASDSLDSDKVEFLKCCKLINTNLKEILETDQIKIYDFDKYCFGLWKIVEADKSIINTLVKQKEAVKFFFGMIKNSLKFNNKNSLINDIGWKLLAKMKSDDWFKNNIVKIENESIIDYKILHKFNIYEDEI
ncbi:hypothetical protein HOK00_00800 [bacterium]|jgi:hypothetical protein|nr:hypothetical protein [bacterium]